MPRGAYPTSSDFASYLDATGLSLAFLVQAGAAGTVQTLSSVFAIRPGDTLFFRQANASAVVTAIIPDPVSQVTLNAPVTTTTGDVALLLPASLDLAGAIAAGIARFERETGRVMLAPLSPTTRTFDPPRGPNGMLSLGDDLAVLSSVTAFNQAQVVGTDVRAMPFDAAAEVAPYNRLQFAATFPGPVSPGAWGAISVTGRWGYGTQIPDDAWQAMLAAAALERLPLIAAAVTGGQVGWTEADVTEQYGPKPFEFLLNMWMGLYKPAMNRYRRVTVGV